MRKLVLSLFFLAISFSAVSAQSLKDIQDDVSDLYSANDAAIKAMSPNRGLIEPRKLQARQGDLKLIYYNIDKKPGLLRMTTGDVLSANLRYRLIDQLMEVEYGDRTYAMDLSMVKAFSIVQDNFVLIGDPLKEMPGRLIYQVHYVDDKTLVLEHHRAEEDYREKLNNVPTSDSQLFRRISTLVLVKDGKVTKITNNKSAMEALRIRKKSSSGEYIKAARLKLKEGKDLAQLISYLAKQGESK
jgi:hypothetical protein